MRISQSGILEATVALIFIVGAVLGVGALFLSNQKEKLRVQDYEKGRQTITQKMEAFLNAPWNDAALTAGTHSEGNLSWVVTNEAAISGATRGKKIEFTYNLPPRGREIASERKIVLSGFKYDDL